MVVLTSLLIASLAGETLSFMGGCCQSLGWRSSLLSPCQVKSPSR